MGVFTSLYRFRQLFQGSHFSGDTKFNYFPGYFQVNDMKSQVNLALNQCLC